MANIAAVNIALFFALALLLEVVSCSAIRMKSSIAPGDTAALPSRFRQQAHEGHRDWVPQLLRDSEALNLRYRAGLWEPPDYTSETLNTHDGYRSSGPGTGAVVPGSGSGAKTAFVFGGSTMWGSGVKDEYTIPSYLNRFATGRYRFFNYGVLAYQSTQEVLRLSLLLRDGNVPDLVVLYNGVNDAVYGAVYGPGNEMAYPDTAEKFAGTGRGILISLAAKSHAWKVVNAIKNRLERRRQRAGSAYELTDEDRAVAHRAAEIYLNNVRYVTDLGETFDFEVVAILQPALITGYEYEAGTVTDFERTLYEERDARVRALVREFYEEVRRVGDVVDLSHAMVDAASAGNYYDALHLGPSGNEIVATAIYRTLGERP